MEKYGTFEIWENKTTGEVVKKQLNAELIKLAENVEWVRREDLEEEDVKNLPLLHTKQ